MADFFVAVYKAIIGNTTVTLLMMVYFILVLSHSMKEAKALDELVGAVRRVIADNRATIGFLPGLIGLLPMPGGALFSAPMIVGPADEASLSAESRTFLNYWFRHVWEYSWPLYPGLLLCVAVLEIDLMDLTLYQFPLCVAAIGAGWLFGLMQVPKIQGGNISRAEFWVETKRFLHGFWPVMLIILSVIIVPAILKLFGIDIFAGELESIDLLLVSLPVSIILFAITRLKLDVFFRCVRMGLNVKLLGTILSVLIFKDVIQVSGAVDELPAVFQQWHVPEEVLFIVLPMLVGYLTGITHSFVSVAFPLLIPFFGDPVDLQKVQMAYAFGFIGVLLSPVHLCLVLSVEYYKSEIAPVLKMLLLPSAVIAAVSIIVYLL